MNTKDVDSIYLLRIYIVAESVGRYLITSPKNQMRWNENEDSEDLFDLLQGISSQLPDDMWGLQQPDPTRFVPLKWWIHQDGSLDLAERAIYSLGPFDERELCSLIYDMNYGKLMPVNDKQCSPISNKLCWIVTYEISQVARAALPPPRKAQAMALALHRSSLYKEDLIQRRKVA